MRHSPFRIAFLVTLGGISLPSCGSTGNAPNGETDVRWEIEEEIRIGSLDGPTEYTFGSIRGVFPDRNGGLWVLDSQIPELRLYDASGQFIRRVGRRGEGPGEFTGNVCAYAAPDGELWVEDSRRRWQRFNSLGELIGSLPVASNLGCGIRKWTQDGRMLVVNSELISGPPAFEFRSSYVEHRLSPDGLHLVPGDTFAVPDIGSGQRFTYRNAAGGEVTTYVPFTARPMIILGTSGSFWIANEDGRYAIERRSLRGDLLARIERPLAPVTIPDSAREDAISRYQLGATGGREVISLADLPTTYPPFDRMVEADNGNLWVWRQAGANEVELDVFSPLGEYLGRATTPSHLGHVLVDRITDTHMYGVMRDDLEVQYAVRLGIRSLQD